MAHGFIYFLCNPGMRGLTKIGFTHKHPLARMDELTKATACPAPFEMLAFFDTATPREVERAIHKELDEYRTNPSREFFAVTFMELQDVAHEWANQTDGICYLRRLNDEADREGREEAETLGALLKERRHGTRA